MIMLGPASASQIFLNVFWSITDDVSHPSALAIHGVITHVKWSTQAWFFNCFVFIIINHVDIFIS